MNKRTEKITYAIIIIVIIAIFIGTYFLLDKILLNNDTNEDKKYKKEITIEEVEQKVSSNGLMKYDLSNVLQNNNQTENYLYIDNENNYEIIYSKFNTHELAKNNYNANLKLIKGKYSNLVEITNISEEKYAKYEAENSANYIVILKIGTSYFQAETTKNNKEKVRNVISSFEK